MQEPNPDNTTLAIEQIIDRHRCGIDGFFTDSKAASNEILSYLESRIDKEETPAMDLPGRFLVACAYVLLFFLSLFSLHCCAPLASDQ